MRHDPSKVRSVQEVSPPCSSREASRRAGARHACRRRTWRESRHAVQQSHLNGREPLPHLDSSDRARSHPTGRRDPRPRLRLLRSVTVLHQAAPVSRFVHGAQIHREPATVRLDVRLMLQDHSLAVTARQAILRGPDSRTVGTWCEQARRRALAPPFARAAGRMSDRPRLLRRPRPHCGYRRVGQATSRP